MKSRVDRMFDLLLDEVVERLAASGRGPAPSRAVPVEKRAASPAVPATGRGKLGGAPEPAEGQEPAGSEPALPVVEVPSHASRMMGRLAVGLLAAVVLINVPLNRHGVTLATAMPDSTSLIIRDGLVVKEEGGPEIYVYEGGTFRWISSLDAFEHYGYRWGDVNVVEDGYLEGYETGPPVHVLLQCTSSPHIYRLEEGVKRWIVDIDAFVAAGHVWEDVRFVSCDYLRDLPDGETIPPGEGPPPQP
jgi:hypothetical protein